MIQPDYQGQGLFNLMVSIRHAFSTRHDQAQLTDCLLLSPAQLRDARHVMLIVIDGMGVAQLEDHCPDGALAGARRGALSSVFPSTTASAITTYMTGDAPVLHGLTGWHMWFRELGVVGAPLPFHVRGSRDDLHNFGLDAPSLFKTRSLFEHFRRDAFIVQPANLSGSAYSRAHSGKARIKKYRNLSSMLKHLVRISHGSKPSYSYAYWPQLDALSHIHGAHSAESAEHLRELDRAIAGLAQKLRGTGTLLLVCADHGFVDTQPKTRIRLEQHPDLRQTLLLPLCGEPRTVFCYVRNGADEDFSSYISEHLQYACEVHHSADLLANGYLGYGRQHPEIHSRLGSHVLFMKDNYCMVDRVPGEQAGPFRQVGVHGGMSEAELQVPLISFGP